jgi:hypothetical protein
MLKTSAVAVLLSCLVGCAAEVADETDVEVEGASEALLATRTVNISISGFGENGIFFNGMVASLEVGGRGSIPNTVRLKYQTTSSGFRMNWADLNIDCRSLSDGAARGDTRHYNGHSLPNGDSAESAFFCPNNYRLNRATAAVNLTSP